MKKDLTFHKIINKIKIRRQPKMKRINRKIKFIQTAKNLAGVHTHTHTHTHVVLKD